jgi:hypothetical protein
VRNSGDRETPSAWPERTDTRVGLQRARDPPKKMRRKASSAGLRSKSLRYGKTIRRLQPVEFSLGLMILVPL